MGTHSISYPPGENISNYLVKMQNSWIILAIATMSIIFEIAQGGVLVNEAPEQESACSSAAEVADYLVADPNNCKKFFSCQRLGPGRGWEATHMDCGLGTAFDPESKICNFIDLVKACKGAKPPPTTTPAPTTMTVFSNDTNDTAAMTLEEYYRNVPEEYWCYNWGSSWVWRPAFCYEK